MTVSPLPASAPEPIADQGARDAARRAALAASCAAHDGTVCLILYLHAGMMRDGVVVTDGSADVYPFYPPSVSPYMAATFVSGGSVHDYYARLGCLALLRDDWGSDDWTPIPPHCLLGALDRFRARTGPEYVANLAVPLERHPYRGDRTLDEEPARSLTALGFVRQRGPWAATYAGQYGVPAPSSSDDAIVELPPDVIPCSICSQHIHPSHQRLVSTYGCEWPLCDQCASSKLSFTHHSGECGEWVAASSAALCVLCPYIATSYDRARSPVPVGIFRCGRAPPSGASCTTWLCTQHLTMARYTRGYDFMSAREVQPAQQRLLYCQRRDRNVGSAVPGDQLILASTLQGGEVRRPLLPGRRGRLAVIRRITVPRIVWRGSPASAPPASGTCLICFARPGREVGVLGFTFCLLCHPDPTLSSYPSDLLRPVRWSSTIALPPTWSQLSLRDREQELPRQSPRWKAYYSCRRELRLWTTLSDEVRAEHSDAGTKIMITNLDEEVITADIQELFELVGPVKSASVHCDENGNSRGTAEVTFRTRADALRSIDEYHGRELDGKPMRITACRFEWSRSGRQYLLPGVERRPFDAYPFGLCLGQPLPLVRNLILAALNHFVPLWLLPLWPSVRLRALDDGLVCPYLGTEQMAGRLWPWRPQVDPETVRQVRSRRVDVSRLTATAGGEYPGGSYEAYGTKAGVPMVAVTDPNVHAALTWRQWQVSPGVYAQPSVRLTPTDVQGHSRPIAAGAPNWSFPTFLTDPLSEAYYIVLAKVLSQCAICGCTTCPPPDPDPGAAPSGCQCPLHACGGHFPRWRLVMEFLVVLNNYYRSQEKFGNTGDRAPAYRAAAGRLRYHPLDRYERGELLGASFADGLRGDPDLTEQARARAAPGRDQTLFADHKPSPLAQSKEGCFSPAQWKVLSEEPIRFRADRKFVHRIGRPTYLYVAMASEGRGPGWSQTLSPELFQARQRCEDALAAGASKAAFQTLLSREDERQGRAFRAAAFQAGDSLGGKSSAYMYHCAAIVAEDICGLCGPPLTQPVGIACVVCRNYGAPLGPTNAFDYQYAMHHLTTYTHAVAVYVEALNRWTQNFRPGLVFIAPEMDPWIPRVRLCCSTCCEHARMRWLFRVCPDGQPVDSDTAAQFAYGAWLQHYAYDSVASLRNHCASPRHQQRLWELAVWSLADGAIATLLGPTPSLAPGADSLDDEGSQGARLATVPGLVHCAVMQHWFSPVARSHAIYAIATGVFWSLIAPSGGHPAPVPPLRSDFPGMEAPFDPFTAAHSRRPDRAVWVAKFNEQSVDPSIASPAVAAARARSNPCPILIWSWMSVECGNMTGREFVELGATHVDRGPRSELFNRLLRRWSAPPAFLTRQGCGGSMVLAGRVLIPDFVGGLKGRGGYRALENDLMNQVLTSVPARAVVAVHLAYLGWCPRHRAPELEWLHAQLGEGTMIVPIVRTGGDQFECAQPGYSVYRWLSGHSLPRTGSPSCRWEADHRASVLAYGPGHHVRFRPSARESFAARSLQNVFFEDLSYEHREEEVPMPAHTTPLDDVYVWPRCVRCLLLSAACPAHSLHRFSAGGTLLGASPVHRAASVLRGCSLLDLRRESLESGHIFDRPDPRYPQGFHPDPELEARVKSSLQCRSGYVCRPIPYWPVPLRWISALRRAGIVGDPGRQQELGLGNFLRALCVHRDTAGRIGWLVPRGWAVRSEDPLDRYHSFDWWCVATSPHATPADVRWVPRTSVDCGVSIAGWGDGSGLPGAAPRPLPLGFSLLGALEHCGAVFLPSRALWLDHFLHRQMEALMGMDWERMQRVASEAGRLGVRTRRTDYAGDVRHSYRQSPLEWLLDYASLCFWHRRAALSEALAWLERGPELASFKDLCVSNFTCQLCGSDAASCTCVIRDFCQLEEAGVAKDCFWVGRRLPFQPAFATAHTSDQGFQAGHVALALGLDVCTPFADLIPVLRGLLQSAMARNLVQEARFDMSDLPSSAPGCRLPAERDEADESLAIKASEWTGPRVRADAPSRYRSPAAGSSSWPARRSVVSKISERAERWAHEQLEALAALELSDLPPLAAVPPGREYFFARACRRIRGIRDQLSECRAALLHHRIAALPEPDPFDRLTVVVGRTDEDDESLPKQGGRWVLGLTPPGGEGRHIALFVGEYLSCSPEASLTQVLRQFSLTTRMGVRWHYLRQRLEFAQRELKHAHREWVRLWSWQRTVKRSLRSSGGATWSVVRPSTTTIFRAWPTPPTTHVAVGPRVRTVELGGVVSFLGDLSLSSSRRSWAGPPWSSADPKAPQIQAFYPLPTGASFIEAVSASLTRYSSLPESDEQPAAAKRSTVIGELKEILKECGGVTGQRSSRRRRRRGRGRKAQKKKTPQVARAPVVAPDSGSGSGHTRPRVDPYAFGDLYEPSDPAALQALRAQLQAPATKKPRRSRRSRRARRQSRAASATADSRSSGGALQSASAAPVALPMAAPAVPIEEPPPSPALAAAEPRVLAGMPAWVAPDADSSSECEFWCRTPSSASPVLRRPAASPFPPVLRSDPSGRRALRLRPLAQPRSRVRRGRGRQGAFSPPPLSSRSLPLRGQRRARAGRRPVVQLPPARGVGVLPMPLLQPPHRKPGVDPARSRGPARPSPPSSRPAPALHRLYAAYSVPKTRVVLVPMAKKKGGDRRSQRLAAGEGSADEQDAEGDDEEVDDDDEEVDDGADDGGAASDRGGDEDRGEVAPLFRAGEILDPIVRQRVEYAEQQVASRNRRFERASQRLDAAMEGNAAPADISALSDLVNQFSDDRDTALARLAELRAPPPAPRSVGSRASGRSGRSRRQRGRRSSRGAASGAPPAAEQGQTRQEFRAALIRESRLAARRAAKEAAAVVVQDADDLLNVKRRKDRPSIAAGLASESVEARAAAAQVLANVVAQPPSLEDQLKESRDGTRHFGEVTHVSRMTLRPSPLSTETMRLYDAAVNAREDEVQLRMFKDVDDEGEEAEVQHGAQYAGDELRMLKTRPSAEQGRKLTLSELRRPIGKAVVMHGTGPTSVAELRVEMQSIRQYVYVVRTSKGKLIQKLPSAAPHIRATQVAMLGYEKALQSDVAQAVAAATLADLVVTHMLMANSAFNAHYFSYKDLPTTGASGAKLTWDENVLPVVHDLYCRAREAQEQEIALRLRTMLEGLQKRADVDARKVVIAYALFWVYRFTKGIIVLSPDHHLFSKEMLNPSLDPARTIFQQLKLQKMMTSDAIEAKTSA